MHLILFPASTGGGGASAAISLEHFFLSLKQYYLELKKEGGARATPTGSPITPLELDGLRGVLSLIRVIAKYVSGIELVAMNIITSDAPTLVGGSYTIITS